MELCSGWDASLDALNEPKLTGLVERRGGEGAGRGTGM